MSQFAIESTGMDNHSSLPPDPVGILGTAVSINPFFSLQGKAE